MRVTPFYPVVQCPGDILELILLCEGAIHSQLGNKPDGPICINHGFEKITFLDFGFAARRRRQGYLSIASHLQVF